MLAGGQGRMNDEPAEAAQALVITGLFLVAAFGALTLLGW